MGPGRRPGPYPVCGDPERKLAFSRDGLEYWPFSRGSPDRDEASFLLRHERARGTLSTGAPFALSIGVAATTLTVGQTTQATATVYTDRRAILTGAAISWTTGNSGAASVSSSGLVTALAPGITMISATVEGATGWGFVEVVPP